MGNEGVTPLILNPGLWFVEWSASTPGRFTRREKAACQLNRRPSSTSVSVDAWPVIEPRYLECPGLILVATSTDLSRLETCLCLHLNVIIVWDWFCLVPFLPPFFFLTSHLTCLIFVFSSFIFSFAALLVSAIPCLCFYIYYKFILLHIILLPLCFILTFFFLSSACFW